MLLNTPTFSLNREHAKAAIEIGPYWDQLSAMRPLRVHRLLEKGSHHLPPDRFRADFR
jgi:hypothetical protein